MSDAAPRQNAAANFQSPGQLAYPGSALQRKCACGGAAGLAGECEACKEKKLQRKLSIGASNDPLEQEADRIADQVMAMSPNGDVSGASLRIQRATEQVAAETDTAPPSVDRALAGRGTPLDPALRREMERRFGYDFSRVRVHTGPAAGQSALDVNAHAFTVGHDIVFGAGQFAPDSRAGKRLLSHELAHVVQQSGGDHLETGRPNEQRRVLPDLRGTQPASRAVKSLFRQTDKTQVDRSMELHTLHTLHASAPTLRGPTWDDIAREIGPALKGPYKDYADYSASIVPGSFLGHPIDRGVRPELIAKLAKAKTAIDAEFAKSGAAIPPGYGISSVGGFRSKAGPHGWGLAIDLDVARNPYVMHEHGEAVLDAQLAPVYNRIAEFMLNRPIGGHQSIIPTIITQRKNLPGSSAKTRADRLGEYYDRLALESQAMKDYFALMKNTTPGAIGAFLAGPWAKSHPGATTPVEADVLRQMWEDYATLGGAIPKGGPPGVTGFKAPRPIGKADRPFATHSGGQQDPAGGFLTIPREVVIGLGRTLTRWGAIDFWGESGDVQHFDDMDGLGREIAAAKTRAEAKIKAAAAATSGTKP
jgi:hypothetical protein